MKAPIRHFLRGSLLVAMFLSSCEEPQRRAESVPEVKVQPPPPSDVPAPATPPPAPVVTGALLPVPEVAAPAPVVSEKKTEAAPETNLPPEDPELSVALVGDKILVSGALRSRLQKDRIIETLTREFPDHEIVDDLKLEYHRIAVGWGNRLADPFLLTYLREVKKPRLAYKKNTLTLEGTVKSNADHQMITEFAIETFSGDTTEKVENRILVEEPTPGKP